MTATAATEVVLGPLQVAGALAHERALDERVHVTRVGAQDAVVFDERLRVAPGDREHVRELEAGLALEVSLGRGERQRAAVRLLRPDQVSERGQGHAALHVGHHRVRPETERLVGVRERARGVTQLSLDESAMGPRLGAPGPAGDRLVEIAQRAARVLGGLAQRATVEPGRGERRVEGEGAIEVGARDREVVGEDREHAARGERERVVGGEREGALAVGPAPFVVPGAHAGVAA
jgi:hypothetical protein